jgi:hypothetical protein
LPPSDQSAFHREVARRFGLVPHFFLSARDDPEIIEKLWGFAAFTGATISGWCRSTVFFPIFAETWIRPSVPARTSNIDVGRGRGVSRRGHSAGPDRQ